MTDEDRLDVLEAKVEAFSTALDRARDDIEDLQSQLDEEREERQRLEAENGALQKRLDTVEARTDMLRIVEDIDDMTGKQRSITLIQHLRREAEKQRQRDRKARASVNHDEAERALQYPDVDRTTIYDDMRRAARLVSDEDVLSYDSSGAESRLRLDLESGEIPESVAGNAAINEVR